MEPSTQPGLFLGRRREAARLIAAIRDRRSLLIFGPPDSGKTSLVDHTLSKLPLGIASRCLHVSAKGTMQRLLQQHVIRLLEAGDPVAQQAYRKHGTRSRSMESWVRKETSGRLRSLLFRAFDRSRYWLFWDDAQRLGLSHFHFLREVIWMRKTPVYLLARGFAHEHLGQAGCLFWSDEQQLEVGPLADDDAGALLEAAIEREGLASLDLSEFRAQVLEASRHLPGAILKMVAMSGQPRYQYGKRVKTKLIHMDYLVQLASRIRV